MQITHVLFKFFAMLAAILLGASLFSLWIKRDLRIWGVLLACSLVVGFEAGLFSWLGLFWLALLGLGWVGYTQNDLIAALVIGGSGSLENRKNWQGLFLFAGLVVFSLCITLRFLPGFSPIAITPKFFMGLEGPLLGLFPLALLVPLAKNRADWNRVLKGTIAGCVGIALLAGLAVSLHVVHLEFKLPTFMAIRSLSNFWLTAIPEEGFYRGFLQNALCKMFGATKLANAGALLLTSAIFAVAHLYWSPDLATLGFVFLAGLLYGGVYLYSNKIESAVFTHFLLNIFHMSCFSYHAM